MTEIQSNYFKRYNRYGWAFTLPGMLLLAVFLFYPVFNSLQLSTMVGQGSVMKFGGLANYKKLLGDIVFLKSLKNTFIFFLIQVPIMLTLAIFLATLLNNDKLHFRGFFRVVIFLPCITSLVTYSVLFKRFFSSTGLVNNLLLSLQVISDPFPFFRYEFWSRFVIIIAMIWRWTGYNMIFFLSGMQNIPREIYEAASIDGASPSRQLFSLTIPLLKPIILFTSVMSTIGTMQLFDEPMNLTEGGPSNATMTLAMHIYNISFRFAPQYGYSAAISYVIVLLVSLLAIMQFQYFKRSKG